MLNTSIHSTGMRRSRRMPIMADSGEQEDRQHRARGRQEDQMISECFGRLTALDEAVIKGLGVGLAGSTAPVWSR
jgi:hypothetical protein